MADQLTRTELLAVCLDRIQAGEMTVEECITRYSEVSEMADLLRLALSLRDAEGEQIVLPDIRKQALERRLLKVWDQRHVQQPSLGWLRPVSAVAAMLLVCIGLLLGLAGLSRPSLPGDTLYGYKRLVERAEVTFASPASKPDLLRQMAETRLDELTMVVARDQQIAPAIFSDVVSAVNEAIDSQPDDNSRQFLYDRAQSVLAALAVQGATDATAAAAMISTPVPQPTVVITEVTATPSLATNTAMPQTATATQLAPTVPSTMTPTATITSSVTPAPQSSAVIENPSATATGTPRRLVTATSLASFTPTATHTSTVPTSTPTATYSPSATSLLPTPFLPTLSAEQLTLTATLTPTATFAFTLTPIAGILPTTQPPSPEPVDPTSQPPTETPTETPSPSRLPLCPTETPTSTPTLDTDPTQTPTETPTPLPDDFTATPTETPPPCATTTATLDESITGN